MKNKLITLYFPVTVNGEEHKSFSMRPSLVKDRLMAAEHTDSAAGEEMLLIANLCDTTREVIESLREADYIQFQKAYSDFLDPPAGSVSGKSNQHVG